MKKTQEEKEAARLAKWQKAQDEAGAEIDNDFGMTVKEVVELMIQEYRKLEWFEDGDKLEDFELGYYFDTNAPGSFCLEFKYKDEHGDVIENSDDSCHLWYYDFDDDTKLKFDHIQYPTVFTAFNPKTKRKGEAALSAIVIDLTQYKLAYERKQKLTDLFADE